MLYFQETEQEYSSGFFFNDLLKEDSGIFSTKSSAADVLAPKSLDPVQPNIAQSTAAVAFQLGAVNNEDAGPAPALFKLGDPVESVPEFASMPANLGAGTHEAKDGPDFQSLLDIPIDILPAAAVDNSDSTAVEVFDVDSIESGVPEINIEKVMAQKEPSQDSLIGSLEPEPQKRKPLLKQDKVDKSDEKGDNEHSRRTDKVNANIETASGEDIKEAVDNPPELLGDTEKPNGTVGMTFAELRAQVIILKQYTF